MAVLFADVFKADHDRKRTFVEMRRSYDTDARSRKPDLVHKVKTAPKRMNFDPLDAIFASLCRSACG